MYDAFFSFFSFARAGCDAWPLLQHPVLRINYKIFIYLFFIFTPYAWRLLQYPVLRTNDKIFLDFFYFHK
jgi:hypothetical protein